MFLTLDNITISFLLYVPVVAIMFCLFLGPDDYSTIVRVFSITGIIVFFIGFTATSSDIVIPKRLYVLSTRFVDYYASTDSCYISLLFILLTLLIVPIALFNPPSRESSNSYAVALYSIQFLLTLSFSVDSLFAFYICFEASVLPLLYIISLFSIRKEKKRASFYLLIFTVVCSIPFLVVLFIFNQYSTLTLLDFFSISIIVPYSTLYLFFIPFFLAFAVKLPIFPLHSWLLEAHVEAPTGGSVVLAALLLKLGFYGLIRFCLPIFQNINESYFPIIQFFVLSSMLYASYAVLSQIDLKRIVAFSSIIHMAYTTLTLHIRTPSAVEASILQTIAHTFTSAAMFTIVGILYSRHHSRLLQQYAGYGRIDPMYSGLLFLLTLCNIAFPLSLNFVGEFLGLFACFAYSNILGTILLLPLFISVVYSFKMLIFISSGIPSENKKNIEQIREGELESLILPLLLMIILGITPSIVLSNYPDSYLVDVNYGPIINPIRHVSVFYEERWFKLMMHLQESAKYRNFDIITWEDLLSLDNMG